MGNTVLATDINAVRALGDLIPFLRVNVFLLHRQQHQLFDASPKNSYTNVPVTLFWQCHSMTLQQKRMLKTQPDINSYEAACNLC